MLLELLGHQVQPAANGVAALEAARASPPDVMLVDIGLPGIDGYEVVRRVRHEPALKGVVLVALTGYGRMEIDRIQWRLDSILTWSNRSDLTPLLLT